MRLTRNNGLLAAMAALAVFTFGAASAPAQDISPAPAFTAEDLSALPRENWPTNGGSTMNLRYSPLDEINRDTVADVKAEWRTHLNGSGLGPGFSGQGEAVVHDGVIYIPTGANDVFALDVETGEILWVWEANIDPERVNLCCGWVVRGVAVGEGKVFVGTLDARMIALDQQTGEKIWEIQAEDPAEGFSITSAPRYYDDLVVTGLAGGEYGIRGRVKAYDADDGELVWTFYTIPGPGQFGHETWPQDNESWRYGGAPVWQTPAVDPELGMIYFSTGNPGPDQNGAVREGDNLFSTSIVALDAYTGEYKWHFQQTRHDLWDYDSSSPVVLFDVEKDGEMRKGIAQISKSGYLFLLDRTNGEPLVGMEQREVPQLEEQKTARTQPIPVGDDIIAHHIDVPPEGWELVNQGRTYTPFGSEGGVLYAPLAGANWMPSAYDPESGYLYVCANESIGGARMEELDELGPEPGEQYMGGNWALPSASGRGIYAAVDVRTNTLVWRYQWSDRCSAGSTATAGGLVFIGRSDGRLMAYNSADGMPVWSFQTDAGVHPSPVIFEHEGSQKILLFSAGTLFSSGPSGDSVWLLSLEGEMEGTEPPAPGGGTPPLDGGEPPAPVTVPERMPDIANGQTIYKSICASCHGDTGEGGHLGGAPFQEGIAIRHIMTVATNGQGEMPAFKGVYSAEELHDVAASIAEDLVKNRSQ